MLFFGNGALLVGWHVFHLGGVFCVWAFLGFARGWFFLRRFLECGWKDFGENAAGWHFFDLGWAVVFGSFWIFVRNLVFFQVRILFLFKAY